MEYHGRSLFFSADINIVTKKRVAFCVSFLVLNVLVQGEERNLGDYCFIQFVSFLVEE